MLYYKYSDYLKNKYGEKVYKLPVNLPEMDVHSVPVQEPDLRQCRLQFLSQNS